MDKAEGTLGRVCRQIISVRRIRSWEEDTCAKEPDIDSSLCEFWNQHASSSLRKSNSVAGGIRVLDDTPRVAVLAVVAVRGCLSAGVSHARWLGAPSSGVEGHLVVGGKVDLLEYVDLVTCEDKSNHNTVPAS